MDMSIVEGVIDEVAPKISGSDKVLILKSTSLPGTTKKMMEKVPRRKFCNESGVFNPKKCQP